MIKDIISSWGEYSHLDIEFCTPEPEQLMAGYFYCPYLPLTKTPVVLDPETFSPQKGILTRYGKKLREAKNERRHS